LSGSSTRLQAIEAVTSYHSKTEDVTALVKELQDGIAELQKQLAAPAGKTKLEHAAHLCHEVIPAMAAVCKAGDTLEGMVADDLWPLAKYQEMLFIM
jgi:glutamine synthetase